MYNLQSLRVNTNPNDERTNDPPGDGNPSIIRSHESFTTRGAGEELGTKAGSAAVRKPGFFGGGCFLGRLVYWLRGLWFFGCLVMEDGVLDLFHMEYKRKIARLFSNPLAGIMLFFVMIFLSSMSECGFGVMMRVH